MKTIEIKGNRYHILRTLENETSENIEKIKNHYGEIYNDFFLLKAGKKNEYLICRSIDDADFSIID